MKREGCVWWERVGLVQRMNEVQVERECVTVYSSAYPWGSEEARGWEKKEVGVGVNQEEMGR